MNDKTISETFTNPTSSPASTPDLTRRDVRTQDQQAVDRRGHAGRAISPSCSLGHRYHCAGEIVDALRWDVLPHGQTATKSVLLQQVRELVLAVSAPDGMILAHRAALDGDINAAVAEAVADIAGMGGDGSVIVAANIADAIKATGFPGDACDAHAHFKRVSGSELLTTILGSHTDSIPVRHQRGARIRAWPAEQLDPDDAMWAIDEAMAAHSRARPITRPGSSATLAAFLAVRPL